ncbi:MAG: TonB-dependent receptor plug domain-containing protein [Chitinophagales bacterium]|nr:TonB-dependent receptor plug domain-containing protein [Chitinophagales bacterium]
MKKLSIFIFIFYSCLQFSFSQNGEITGTIRDTLLMQNLEFAAIAVENDMHYITGISNQHGIYYINPVPPGVYKIVVAYMNSFFVKENVEVHADQVTKVDFNVSSAIGLDSFVVMPDWNEDLLNPFEPDIGLSVDAEKLNEGPSKEISDFIKEAPYVSVEDGQIRIKGARPEATQIIIDGMYVRGSGLDIPISSIRKIDVLTGSIPAKYGDAIGGFIVIETKGF